MNNNLEKYYTLSYYTLSLGDVDFIHQLIVDAYAAQNADYNTKPITLTFALIGLYLVNEKGYSGKQVQLTHITLAKANHEKRWPTFTLTKDKATMTVSDVVAAPDNEKQEMIKKWNNAVWKIWKIQEKAIKNLLSKYLDFKS